MLPGSGPGPAPSAPGSSNFIHGTNLPSASSPLNPAVSSLWSLSTLGWLDVCSIDFKHFYPTSVLETGSFRQQKRNLHPNQPELISGDQNGNICVWDLTANSCSCELVPDVDIAMRSLTVMWDGSLVVAANNKGTCYV
ncbi:unnamed protein product [Lactuca saligna]|uniref:Target of rapamycin complex subunit LST8 n=1 Tax=Lactuca saligna TaxID=75948 RepID=A0AA35ZJ54_LACSI|nr:unnamed protein product [Lactuca saligna]